MELLIIVMFMILLFGAGYAFRGLIGREIKKLSTPLFAEFARVENSIKAEVAKVAESVKAKV